MRAREYRAFGAVLALLPFLPGNMQGSGDPRPPEDFSGGARWGANYFPNVVLTTHEGKRVRFFDDLIKGKVVVINFIYTTCPDVCPLETARLAELQSILGDRVGRDVFMYSISIDPATDTPEALKEYAEKFQAGPGWLFLTGKAADITLLRKKLSLYREKDEQGSKDHNLSLIMGNQSTGRWMKSGPYENPYFLANEVGSWLHNWKTPAPNQSSYAEAPKLRQLSMGENLFRTRCASCHIIGGRELVPASQDGRLLGPDLLGVTERRDPTWLARWLTTPDKLLAEGDPIALELFARHGNVSMPNMSLNEQDVTALIGYLETESKRVEQYGSGTPLAQGVARTPGACCQKDKAPVLSASSGPAAAEPPGTVTGHERRGGISKASVISSFGLGWILLLLSVVFRRRSCAETEGRLSPLPAGSRAR